MVLDGLLSLLEVSYMGCPMSLGKIARYNTLSGGACIGVILGLCRDNVRLMEKKMETPGIIGLELLFKSRMSFSLDLASRPTLMKLMLACSLYSSTEESHTGGESRVPRKMWTKMTKRLNKLGTTTRCCQQLKPKTAVGRGKRSPCKYWCYCHDYCEFLFQNLVSY